MTTTQTIDILSLSRFERIRRAFAALAVVAADPDRTDQVLVFTSHINAGTTASRIGRFMTDPDGRKLYTENRAIDSTLDLDALAALPAGTLGHAYATFLRDHGLTPEVFDGAPPEFTDPRAAYMVQRLRQSHDLWHVVTGYETDPRGEVALQAFTFGQVGAPGSLILAIVGTVKGFGAERAVVSEVWAAYRAGKAAERFATFLWEDHWATPLDEVREMLGVAPVARAAA
jgi:ubiquinone biosynthesis protein COQ4